MEEADKEEIRCECVRLLREVGCDEGVVKHCCAVAELALEIANRHYNKIDEKLIFRGALLHDLGRARSHGIDHGFVGGELARELGLEEKLVRIIQRHVGAGITAEEAKEVGLPPVDFVPETMEEKIVAHADNLIDDWRRMSLEEAITDLKAKLGAKHPALARMIALHKDVSGEGQQLGIVIK